MIIKRFGGKKMAVFRVVKNEDYSVMSNFHLRDNRLSLKAKGLLSEVLSLPDWVLTGKGLFERLETSANGLSTLNDTTPKEVLDTLKELEQFGYASAISDCKKIVLKLSIVSKKNQNKRDKNVDKSSF